MLAAKLLSERYLVNWRKYELRKKSVRESSLLKDWVVSLNVFGFQLSQRYETSIDSLYRESNLNAYENNPANLCPGLRLQFRVGIRIFQPMGSSP